MTLSVFFASLPVFAVGFKAAGANLAAINKNSCSYVLQSEIVVRVRATILKFHVQWRWSARQQVTVVIVLDSQYWDDKRQTPLLYAEHSSKEAFCCALKLL